MAWPAIKKFVTPAQFKDHVEALDFSQWRPIGIVIHNTAEPTLKRWHEIPRERWMANLENYYKKLGWSGGPHLFIDDGADGIGLFNPLNKRGVHSPSFNAQWLGFEHVGDYAKEDDDAGPGLRVKQNGIAAMAIVCAKLGIDPRTHIKLHKEDPRTDHDCPGRDMAQDKAAIIEAIIEYMGEGGDLAPNWGAQVEDTHPEQPRERVFSLVTTVDALNMRVGSSASQPVVAVLPRGVELAEIGPSAMNGATKWLHVANRANQTGWVSQRFTQPIATPTTPAGADPAIFTVTGKMSTFGGPDDTGVKSDEGLAIFESVAEAEKHAAGDFFMTQAEARAPGLARRLKPGRHYIACRWNYNITSRRFLQDAVAHVTANGKTIDDVRPMDWGPHVDTRRATDLSPGLAHALGLSTDDTCTVVIRKSGK